MENTKVIQNDARPIAFRRDSTTLVILGAGVIIFGFWTVLKVLAYIFLDIPLFDTSKYEIESEEEYRFLMAFLFFFITSDLLVRLYVGARAISEGLGKKVRKGYLVFNLWLILFGIFSVISVIMVLMEPDDEYIETYASLFMELSSLTIIIEVFIAALSVRRYKKTHIKGSR